MLVVSTSLSAGACGHTSTYGGLPSYLPKATLPVNRVVNASATRPKVGVEGDTVAVTLEAGHVLATVVGPAVPASVIPPPPTTQATFTVTLAAATGDVPINIAAFTIVDELGRLHHPQRPPGAIPPPAAPSSRGPVTFQLTDVLPVGAGTIRWAPQGTQVMGWEFTVEID